MNQTFTSVKLNDRERNEIEVYTQVTKLSCLFKDILECCLGTFHTPISVLIKYLKFGLDLKSSHYSFHMTDGASVFIPYNPILRATPPL